jgi:hypothetical protein
MKERRNEGEHGGCIYENTIIKPVEIVLRRGKEDRGGTRQGVNLRYIVNIYVNIIIYPPVQRLYDTKVFFKKLKKEKKKENKYSETTGIPFHKQDKH